MQCIGFIQEDDHSTCHNVKTTPFPLKVICIAFSFMLSSSKYQVIVYY